MMPIGPAPVTSTSSPSTGNANAVCTALPRGSKIAATSRSMPVAVPPDVAGGDGDVVGEGAGVGHADAGGARALHAPPAMQLRQRPQTMCPSPLTISPTARSVTSVPRSTISPTNSWPTTSGTGTFCCAQRVPLVDVEVGPADAGAQHTDQDVVTPDDRLGHVLHPEPRLAAGFHERPHGDAVAQPRASGTEDLHARQ